MSGFTYDNPSPSYGPNLMLEPKHMAINVDVDVEKSRANLAVEIVVHCNNPFAKTLVLNGIGFLNLNVTSKAGPIDWLYNGEKITITWDDPFKFSEKRIIVIVYMVKDPISGMFFSVPDEHYPQRPLFMVTDHETERARYWLACVDHPSVRPTVEFRIKAPKGLVVLATGKEVAHQDKPDHQISVWKFTQPCPSYLVCFAVGDFVHVEAQDALEHVPTRFYSVKGVENQDLGGIFHPTPKMIAYLENKLKTPFPFQDKYYQLAVPGVPIGAMENITLTTWSFCFMYSEVDGVDCETQTDMTNVHEIAHSYFGDSVIYRHYDDAWLKEGWAKFMELVWLEDNVSMDEALYHSYLFQKDYTSECQQYTRPVVENKYNSSWDMFDKHTYPGAALRIKQLRHILGDSIFWQAVQDYLKIYAGTNVETSDLRKVFEKHSGLNLVRYFDEWFYSPGYPEVNVTYTYNPETKSLKLTATQTIGRQSDDEEQNQNHVIGMSIPVLVTDATNKTYGSHLVFENDATVFTAIQLEKKPVTIEIDPNGHCLVELKFSADIEILKQTLEKSKSVLSRIRATQELLRTNTKQAIDEVEEAMKLEKFWGVKVEAAKALAGLKSKQSLQALMGMIRQEAEANPISKALSEIVTAARYLVDATLKHEMVKILQIQGLPSRTYASALECIGWQGIPDDCPLIQQKIEENLTMPSGLEPKVAQGGLRALGLNRSVKAYEWLLDHVGYGKLPDDCREAAIWGLYYSTKWGNKVPKSEGIKRLTELLNDPHRLVRRAAIDALLYLETQFPKLEQIKSTLSNQDQVWLTRKIKQAKPKKEQETQKPEASNFTPFLTKIFKSNNKNWQEILNQATAFATSEKLVIYNIILDNWDSKESVVTVHYGELPPDADKVMAALTVRENSKVTGEETTETTTTTPSGTTTTTATSDTTTSSATSDPTASSTISTTVEVSTTPIVVTLPILKQEIDEIEDEYDDEAEVDEDGLTLEMKYRKESIGALKSQLAAQKAELQGLKTTPTPKQAESHDVGSSSADSRKRSVAHGNPKPGWKGARKPTDAQ